MVKKKQAVFSIVLLLVIGLLVFNRHTLFSLLTGKGFGTDATVTMIKEYEIKRSETDLMDNVYSGENILIFSDQSMIKAFDLEGTPLWSKSFNEDVIIDHTRGLTLVVEKQTGNTYLLDDTGEIVASNLAQGPVLSVDLLDNKTTILFSQGDKGALLLDSKLEPLTELVVADGSIINHDINLAEERITLLVLKDNQGALSTAFTVYNLSGEPITNQNLNGIAMNVFYHKGEYFVVYNWGIQIFDEKMNADQKIELARINSAHRDKEMLYLTTGSTTQVASKGELEITAVSMDKKSIEFHNKMKENYDNIDTNQGSILVQQKNNIQFYDAKGALVYSHTYPQSVRKAMLPHKNIMILVYPDKITVNQVSY